MEHHPPAASVDAPLIVIPGVDDLIPDGSVSPLELAARRTLRELTKAGLLTDVHAVHSQLLLDLARGYSSSVRQANGKVTVAASTTAAQIQALLDRLPKPEAVEDPEVEAFAALVKDLRESRP